MTSRTCNGPATDRDCGALYCPRDPQHEPEPGDSWQDCCDQCWALRGWSDELAGDCERDEAYYDRHDPHEPVP